MENQLGNKIRKVRQLKGYTQDFMASKLNITQKAYSKLEREETKLDWPRISEIGEVLELEPVDLISFDDSMVFKNCKQSGKFVESTLNNNFPEELKEQYEERIAHLTKEVDFLRNQLQK